MNIGIIGLGRVYQHYKMNFFKDIVNENNVFIFDIDKRKIEIELPSFPLKKVNSLEEFLNKSIDLVIISSPSGLHYEQTKFFLENKINVLCEKPATMKISELNELIKISENNNLIYAIFFQNRFNRAIQKVKNAVLNNKFGKINLCSIKLHWCRYQSYYEDGWHGTWKSDGGVINQQAIHHIDALSYIGGEIESVCSLCTNLKNKLEAEDTTLSLVKFKNNSVGTIEATTAIRPKDSEASISVFGDLGFAKIGGIALNKLIAYKDNSIDLNDNQLEEESEEVSSGYGNSHIRVLKDVLDAIKYSREPIITSKTCLHTTKVVHAIYKSSDISRWVKIDDAIDYPKLGV
ncbi:Gfo/Idh/MocA family protein [Prochlorococcus marinus]|uniref:Gfo/Idh/MocA family protein n=1 Tax=Prochlorococcus marinus TaxID=1219 RepID=UPI00053B051C|nr:Gfo/Idh/MocA family oxidoreductase [Prochlorococcus marinus]